MYSKKEKREILTGIKSRMLDDGDSLGCAIEKVRASKPEFSTLSRATVSKWRQPKGSRIDRYIRLCMNRGDDKRTDKVEDAFYKKLEAGLGSPTDYIFYLTNRRPGRWKHSNAIINNVIQNSVKNTANHGEDLTSDELRRIVRQTEPGTDSK